MKLVRHFIQTLVFLLNSLVAIGFLICAYSPYISPTEHPVGACAGLFMPIFIALNLSFCLIWLCLKPWGALFPLAVFALGWNSLWTYFPLGSIKEQTAGSQTLKFLTYNTQGIAPGEEKEEGNNAILTYLSRCEADIICLQEFIPGIHASQKEINQALSAYPYHSSTRIKGGDALACYSRYPILEEKEINYPSLYNRSILYRIKIGQDTIVVINNHLESNKLDAYDKKVYNEMLKSPQETDVKTEGKHLLRKLADAAALRAPQADSVAQTIWKNQAKYMLVCGDFNDSPISYAHRVIGKGLNDAFVEAGAGPGFTYNQNHLYFRIDHIFTSPAFRVLECKVDRSIRASDHYPVWCIVEK